MFVRYSFGEPLTNSELFLPKQRLITSHYRVLGDELDSAWIDFCALHFVNVIL